MDNKYTFEMFWEDLDNGFQLYYNYMDSLRGERGVIYDNKNQSRKRISDL